MTFPRTGTFIFPFGFSKSLPAQKHDYFDWLLKAEWRRADAGFRVSLDTGERRVRIRFRDPKSLHVLSAGSRRLLQDAHHRRVEAIFP